MTPGRPYGGEVCARQAAAGRVLRVEPFGAPVYVGDFPDVADSQQEHQHPGEVTLILRCVFLPGEDLNGFRQGDPGKGDFGNFDGDVRRPGRRVA